MNTLNSSLYQNDQESDGTAFRHLNENMSLKAGMIIAIYDIDHPKNKFKTGPEYDIVCNEKHSQNSSVPTIYQNCIALDRFGSIPDFFEFKYRTTDKRDKDGNSSKEIGSHVMILCVNGYAHNAVIIGGLPHPARKSTLTKEKGTHLQGEFNGLSVQVDNDGALTLKFQGAKKNDGTLINKEIGGSTVGIEKDGSIQAKTKNKETIRLDQTKKTIDVIAEKDISVITDSSTNLTSKKDLNINVDKMLANANGMVTFKAGGVISFETSADMNMKFANSMIQSDGNIMVKATAVNVNAQTIMLGPVALPALTLNTFFLGTGNLGGPVLSVAIGPFSSSVFISG